MALASVLSELQLDEALASAVVEQCAALRLKTRKEALDGLKALGIGKVGHRLKLVSVILDAPAQPPAPAAPPQPASAPPPPLPPPPMTAPHPQREPQPAPATATREAELKRATVPTPTPARALGHKVHYYKVVTSVIKVRRRGLLTTTASY